jgi:hypothetical protein
MSISLIGMDGANIASPSNGVPVSLAIPSNAPADVGGVRIFSENDAGDVTGLALLRSPETSLDYRLRVGMDTVLFNDTFNATTQNTHNWAYTFATMTAAQPGAGSVNFSTVQGTTAAHGAFMRSFQFFPVVGTAPVSVEISAGAFTAPLVADEVWLMGLGTPSSAILPPTDGIWLKCTSAGWSGVISYSGVQTDTGTIAPLGDLSTFYKWAIVIGEAEVQFWKDDVLMGSIDKPAANGQTIQSAALPIFLHKYNTGAVSNTNTMRVSDATVTLMDLNSTKPWPHQMAGAGYASYVGQNGHTQGKTSLWTNNTAPVAVALTNTAGAFTSLGGIAAVLPTLAANSDGIVFSYQVPAATINITGRNLYITGVKIQGAVSVVLAGGPVIYAYALAFGHTAATLVTAETASFASATTHSARIIPLGLETYPATAAVGTLGSQQGALMEFDTPVCVRPGEFVQFIARNIGTVTTSGAITLVATVTGYWE